MKKSTFAAMILGTIGGLLFALGMCMALIPEWNAFKPGVIMGASGIVVLIAMVFIWRKMEHKPALKISGKVIGSVLIGVIGSLLLGTGLYFATTVGQMVLGILVGIAGIVILLCLIPFIKGLK